MLNFLKKRRSLVLWFAALLAAILFIYGSETMQNCIQDQPTNKETQPPKERPSLLSVQVVCAWRTIDANNAPIIAIFTIIIGTFTGLLFIDGKDKARKELRAYIGVKTQHIRRIGQHDFQAVVIIENTGKTPAHNVRRFLDVGVGSESGPDNGFTEPRMTQRMPLAPTAQWEIRQRFWVGEHVTIEDLPLIGGMGTNRFAFVWGRIEYFDIYGERRQTDFRFITREISINENGEVVGWALHPTEDGNEAT